MSLTREAVRERTWRKFPRLQSVLEDRPLMGRFEVPHSAADTEFDRINRVAKLGALIESHRALLLTLAREGDDAIRDDLERELHAAVFELEQTAEWFRDMARRTEQIASELRSEEPRTK